MGSDCGPSPLTVLHLAYYPDADIVCARAKNHYSPDGEFDLEESGTQLESGDANRQLEAFKANFRPLHEKSKRVMYFT